MPNRSSARIAIRTPARAPCRAAATRPIAADEAELLTRHREDEVGLLLGHELALGLAALEQPLAEDATRADRDLRLAGRCSPPPCGSAAGSRNEVNRSSWYSLRKPTWMATNAASTRGQQQTQRSSGSSAPETAIMPSTSALMTSAVPRSGCSMTSASGTAREGEHQHHVGVARSRPRASRFSASSIAMPTTSATLANSDGCTEKPAGSTIHECEPLMVAPERGQHRDQADDRQHVDERRVGAQHAVVEERGGRAQEQADARVEQVPLGEGLRVRTALPTRPGGSRSRPGPSRPGTTRGRRAAAPSRAGAAMDSLPSSVCERAAGWRGPAYGAGP